MEPAYHSGQFLILDKHSDDYGYGDVVAVRKENIEGLLVKRIVALPGDLISIQEGILYVNGCAEEYGHGKIDYAGIAEAPFVLGEEFYFVLGDNVQASRDSRYSEIGLIHRDEIRGKVVCFTRNDS